MLSRAADNLYWMARYIERAESLARLADANSQFLLDTGLSPDPRDVSGWMPILEVTCLDEDFERVQKEKPELGVLEFLTISPENNESIRACIAMARENARMVRDQISEEIWFEVNRLHLFLQSPGATIEWEFSPEEFYNRILNFSLLFQGLVEATIAKDEGYSFIILGRFLERADKTTRILDVPAHHRNSTAVSPWPTVLGACSARAAYLTTRGASVKEKDAIDLLLFDHHFPRSMRFCLREVDNALHRISGTPTGTYGNEAERLTGALLANVDFNGPSDLERMGLHAYADQIQDRLNDIGQQIFETYVLLPAEVAQAPAWTTQLAQGYQQAQQQQQ